MTDTSTKRVTVEDIRELIKTLREGQVICIECEKPNE